MQTVPLVVLCSVLAINTLYGCEQEDYSEFFALPAYARDSLFYKLDPATQVDIFVVGRRVWHPPKPIVGILARSGREVIPAIIQRMEIEESEIAIIDLMRELELMACDYHVRFGQKVELSSRLEAIVARMEIDDWREQARGELAGLRNCWDEE